MGSDDEHKHHKHKRRPVWKSDFRRPRHRRESCGLRSCVAWSDSTQARTLPVAPAEKAACADRSYFYDADGAFGRRFAGVAAAAWGVSVTRIRVNKCYRVLSYARACVEINQCVGCTR